MSAPSPGRAEAAELIWDWRRGGDESTPRSYARERRRGALQAVAGAFMGGIFLWLGWTLPARIVLSVAGLILFCSLVSPGGLYATLERFMGAVAMRLGAGLMWTLMLPVFYLFFMPFGLLFRRGRRDRLKRFFDADAPSYWEPHEGPTAASSSHRNQF